MDLCDALLRRQLLVAARAAGAEGWPRSPLLYAAVERWSGRPAGLLAGAAPGVTPVATLMFRFDNPDALLSCC